MSAAEYACDYWNGVPPSGYSYPQQVNMDMQFMENYPFRNYYPPGYPQTNQSNYLDYNNQPEIKTENAFHSCSYQVNRVESSSSSPPEMIPIVEHDNNLNRLLECCQKDFEVQSALNTRETINPRFSNEEKRDESPALRALLTKPPQKKQYNFAEGPKQHTDKNKIYREQERIESSEKLFEYERRNAQPLSSPVIDNCSSEDGDITQNNCEANQMPNYYPWMKTQGKKLN